MGCLSWSQHIQAKATSWSNWSRQWADWCIGCPSPWSPEGSAPVSRSKLKWTGRTPLTQWRRSVSYHWRRTRQLRRGRSMRWSGYACFSHWGRGGSGGLLRMCRLWQAVQCSDRVVSVRMLARSSYSTTRGGGSWRKTTVFWPLSLSARGHSRRSLGLERGLGLSLSPIEG